MTTQKIPNLFTENSADLGLLSPARINEDGVNEDQIVGNTSNGIVFKNKFESSLVRIQTLTSAEILALNATPITVIAAPGNGFAIIVKKAIARHAAGTAYTTGAGEDITLKYTNASGAQVITAFDSDGFLDAATAQIRSSLGIGGTPVNNAAIVAHLLVGEVADGDFDVELFVEYDIIPTDFAGA